MSVARKVHILYAVKCMSDSVLQLGHQEALIAVDGLYNEVKNILRSLPEHKQVVCCIGEWNGKLSSRLPTRRLLDGFTAAATST